jgi:hypothetical protein
MVDGRMELMAMTTWTDMDAMTAVLGPARDEPRWLPGLEALVESSDTSMYETIAESFGGQASLAPNKIDLPARRPLGE